MRRQRFARCRREGAVLAALALACASGPPPAPPAPAEVSVEWLGGFAAGALGALDAPDALPEVEVVLDATLSLAENASSRLRWDEVGQLAAARYLETLPEATPARLRVLGLTTTACGSALPLDPLGDGPRTLALANALRALPPPRSEASLALALDDVAARLTRDGVAGARVVVLSDFAPACGGDVCAAARRLVAAGAEIEAVVLGEAGKTTPPACLAQIATGGAPAVLPPPGQLPAFRVLRAPAGAEQETPQGPLAVGIADGRPRQLPAGNVVVRIDVEPPIVAGPFLLGPGSRARVRILELPTLEPPVREVWSEQLEPSFAGEAGR